MKKILRTFLLIFLMAVVAGIIYLFFISPEEKFQSIYLVPGNAAYIIETDDPFGAWQKVVHSGAWNLLKSNELLADINKDIESMDSVIS
jgi:hypothetical protein